MDWENVLVDLLSLVAKIVVSIFIPYVAKLLKEKFHNDKVNKYIDKAENVICQCVDYVNQIYVDGLKAEGKFDKAAKATAFEMSYDYVMRMLNEKTKEAIVEVFGDVNIWVNSMIESSVRNSSNHISILPAIEGVEYED